MLQQIKHILPDTWSWTRRAFGVDTFQWKNLKVGQVVCFGPMAQKELNVKRLRVMAVKEYEFSQASFCAYALGEDGKQLCWMIVADQEGGVPYLALSRRISSDELERLLAEEDLHVLRHSSRMKDLFLREHTQGLRDWITMRYGRRIEGIRGKQREHDAERVFEYELYVNDRNDKAIEIERFLDGHMDAYATIYRPISDVLEIVDSRPPPVHTTRQMASVKESMPAILSPARQETEVPARSSLKDVEETRKIIRRQQKHKPSPTQQGRLECDLTTAWRLIDEAVRSDMRLSDVVRKVLGLPVEAVDLVSFNFTLHEEDYIELGKRYGISPANQTAIRARIIQELEEFAGKRRG